MYRVKCIFGLCAGCGTPPIYYAHAIGTQRPVEKKKKKLLKIMDDIPDAKDKFGLLPQPLLP